MKVMKLYRGMWICKLNDTSEDVMAQADNIPGWSRLPIYSSLDLLRSSALLLLERRPLVDVVLQDDPSSDIDNKHSTSQQE
jgi:hypothetical protein